MSFMDQLDTFRRPEVKALAQQGQNIWLGSSAGLYYLCNDDFEPMADWQGQPINALAASSAELFIGVSDHGKQMLIKTDHQGRILEHLPALPEDRAKSLLYTADTLLAGGKRGIYRLQGGTWQHCYGQGHTEIIGFSCQPKRLLAFCKKQGSQAHPALLVSTDQGKEWVKVLETGYHDGILAAWEDTYITRWRGFWRAEAPIRMQKRPYSVAYQTEGLRAWVTGNKLVCAFANGTSTELEDPRFAEAEHLGVLPDGEVLVTGVGGAFLVDIGSGRVQDLFAQQITAPHAAKVKRLWRLEGGRLMATATFGTFYSDDDGAHWQPSQAEWATLDAEGLTLSVDGAWYLATQRGLFSSWDNGASWQHQKLTTQPHFAELTGLAWTAGRLALGSKAGLFLSMPDQPKELSWNRAVGHTTVHGLLADGDQLWVGTQDGRLLQVDANTGQGQVRALLQEPVQPLIKQDNSLWLFSGGRLFVLTADQVQSLTHPEGARLLKQATCTDQGLWVWDDGNGWCLNKSNGQPEWQKLVNWLPGVKSVVGGSTTLITNRSTVRTLP